MFGYVIADKRDMNKEEIERYRSFYCGLCHALKVRYGIRAQMTLNYDLTFVAILLNALYEEEENKEKFTCFLHPFRSTARNCNSIIDYCADMTILLAYYKAVDDWQDENKKTMMHLLKKSFEKVKQLYPEKDSLISDRLKTISELEKENCQDIDLISGVFGDIMAEILLYREDEYAPRLRKMGFYLGKFIYLMDASCDLEYDRKHSQYNPFKETYDSKQIKDILDDMIARCVEEYSYLPIVKDTKILENILYSGVWLKYDYLNSKRKEGEQ